MTLCASLALSDVIRQCVSGKVVPANLVKMARKSEAMVAYRAALRSDPRFSDWHYILSLLCQELVKP